MYEQNQPHLPDPPSSPIAGCLRCPLFRAGCRNPSVISSSLDELCDAMQSTRIQLGISYRELSERSGISLPTTKRLLLRQVKDPSWVSVQALARELLCDASGCSCAARLAAERTQADRSAAAAATQEAQALRQRMEGIDAAHGEELGAVRQEQQRKIDFLRQELDYHKARADSLDLRLSAAARRSRRRNLLLIVLSVLLAACLVIILIALHADFVDPGQGFFWTEGPYLGDLPPLSL